MRQLNTCVASAIKWMHIQRIIWLSVCVCVSQHGAWIKANFAWSICILTLLLPSKSGKHFQLIEFTIYLNVYFVFANCVRCKFKTVQSWKCVMDAVGKIILIDECEWIVKRMLWIIMNEWKRKCEIHFMSDSIVQCDDTCVRDAHDFEVEMFRNDVELEFN